MHAEACTEQKITYTLLKDKLVPTCHINQMTQRTGLSATRQANNKKELAIHKNEYLTEHPRVKGQLLCIYADGFTPKSEGKMGQTDLLELELKMALGSVVRQKPRLLNLDFKASLDSQIGEWLQIGLISKSISEYNSPLVPVKKKDGEVRWCVDFRQVNYRINS